MKTTAATCPMCAGSCRLATAAELRKTRKAAGLKLAQAAKLAGVSVPYLSQMETGAKAVTGRVTKAYMRMNGGKP